MYLPAEDLERFGAALRADRADALAGEPGLQDVVRFEARRALGSALRLREESRDARIVAWLDSLRADLIFAWRQLGKRKATSLAAILSLGLAIGACTAAFRIAS